MRIVTWNIRGLASEVKIEMVSRLETKLQVVFGDLITRNWGDDNFDFRYETAVGRSGGLITIWDKEYFQMNKEYCVNQFVVVEGIWLSESWEGVLINVYTPNTLMKQKILWDEMIEI
ncbi:hypothetical protein ERO13_A08G110701v2 [Gossypium hirsutum]|uniref:Endonuclease/exonuclease/phosphatase domain-containing protein n=1 Tax=Gossypium mustelinum TaxID=34275 RepID=A0A5D2Y8A3_GOSMU|nr:hypothetical protein ERO13_A08G110701v2 [Gossypium hirsutum]TYJ22336.1 hypothetical protein E1A91_A08G118700v1 [Gossypium mustelinum]